MRSQQKEKTNSKRPQYRVCVPKEVGEDTFWTIIGSGWDIKSGGINVELNAYPIGTKICIFPNLEPER